MPISHLIELKVLILKAMVLFNIIDGRQEFL